MRASFVTLAAYDWRLLPTSIGAYYEHAAEILVGLDGQRLTWAGQPFELDRAVLEATLMAIDPERKIHIVEANYCHHGRTPMQNDCAEREYLAACAREDWVVEVDADELLDDVPALFTAMAAAPDGYQVFGTWRDIWKVIGSHALVVRSSDNLCALATRSRHRNYARQTGERAWIATTTVEHLTLGRSDTEVAQKLTGWSHATQVRPRFLDLWRAATLENYEALRNVHPFRPARWPALEAVPVSSLGWGGHLQRQGGASA